MPKEAVLFVCFSGKFNSQPQQKGGKSSIYVRKIEFFWHQHLLLDILAKIIGFPVFSKLSVTRPDTDLVRNKGQLPRFTPLSWQRTWRNTSLPPSPNTILLSRIRASNITPTLISFRQILASLCNRSNVRLINDYLEWAVAIPSVPGRTHGRKGSLDAHGFDVSKNTAKLDVLSHMAKSEKLLVNAFGYSLPNRVETFN